MGHRITPAVNQHTNFLKYSDTYAEKIDERFFREALNSLAVVTIFTKLTTGITRSLNYTRGGGISIKSWIRIFIEPNFSSARK